jgi:hypothetical protein
VICRHQLEQHFYYVAFSSLQETKAEPKPDVDAAREAAREAYAADAEAEEAQQEAAEADEEAAEEETMDF